MFSQNIFLSNKTVALGGLNLLFHTNRPELVHCTAIDIKLIFSVHTNSTSHKWSRLENDQLLSLDE
jgi:hypothetical protein